MKYILSILCILLFSCGSKTPSEKAIVTPLNIPEKGEKVKLKWAKNFEITHFQDYTQLDILVNKNKRHTYFLSKTRKEVNSKSTITIPTTSVASASCVYTKMFDELGKLDYIKAIDYKYYIYSQKINTYVKTNNVLEFEARDNLDIEGLFNLSPDVLLTWTSNDSKKNLEKLEQLGIPIVFMASYKEKHPLARAEWIKCIALFADEFKKASEYFNEVEKQYLALAQNKEEKTSILINAPYGANWHFPPQKSFITHQLADANLKVNHLDSLSDKVSIHSLETVLSLHQDDDIWINPSYYSSLSEMKKADKRFEHFKAFKDKQVYNCMKRKVKQGGIDYWELGVIRPDLILKDLIHIQKNDHPDSLFFFNKLEP
ncbi:MAG: ABC transporter substrate-binding protein [Flavobacteriales bacterium]